MKRSMTKRLVLITLALFTLMMSSWIIWCYASTRNTLLGQKKQDIKLLLSRTGDYVELYSEGLDATLLAFGSTLDMMKNEPRQIQEAITALQKSSPGKVLSIACVTEAGDIFCNRAVALEIFGNDHFKEFFDIARADAYQGIRWSEPYVSPLTLTRTVALYKPVKTSGGMSVVIMELNLDQMLSSLLRATNDASMTWAVVSGEGALVATSDDFTTISSDYKQIPRALLEKELNSIRTLSINAEEYEIGNGSYIFFRKQLRCMDWQLIALCQKSTLTKAIEPLLVRILLTGVLHLSSLTLLLTVLARRFTGPITKMASLIMKTENPLDISFPKAMKGNDELSVLAGSVDDMIFRVKKLNRERETILQQQRLLEIDALQGQIHPHFLGNTLACIQSLIKDGKRDESLAALTALVKLLNYSVAQTETMAVLGDELNCALEYVRLRQMRASYPFEYHVCVPSIYLRHPVPRLILQPIIENSVVHGFAGLKSVGQIVVTGYIKEGKLCLCIDDNGVGAAESLLSAVGTGKVPPSDHAHGIGVYNVFKRLALNDAEENLCEICLNQEGGVRVVLDLGKYNA